MSIEKYLQSKSKTMLIAGVDLTEYSENLRDSLILEVDKKSLCEQIFDITQISGYLTRMGYPRVNNLIFDMFMPGSLQEEYKSFVEWAAKSNDISANKLRSLLANIKSMQFANQPVIMSDIESIINTKCDNIAEKAIMLSDIIRSQKAEWSSDVAHIKITANGDFKIITESSEAVLQYKDDCFFVQDRDNLKSKDQLAILEILDTYKSNFRSYYFSYPSNKRSLINENIRKMYLGKMHMPFNYSLSIRKPEAIKGMDTWLLVARNSDVKYELDSYRMADASKKPRLVSMEEKNE